MPIITLPDGNNLSFSNDVTGLGVAEKLKLFPSGNVIIGI